MGGAPRQRLTRTDPRPWVVRHAWVVVGIGGAAAAAALLVALLRPELWVGSAATATSVTVPSISGSGLSAKEHADVRANEREFWLKIAAGVGALAGATLAWARFEMSKEQADLDRARLDSERFGQAIDHLGTSQPDVMLGGLHALGALGDVTSCYRREIVDVLCAFIRARCDDDNSPGASDASSESATTAASGERRLTMATQTALGIVGRSAEWNLPMDLRGVRFTDVDFSGMRLAGVDLSYGRLAGARFNRAHLEGVRLVRAKLIRATLVRANLTRANLTGANFTDAVLSGADLTEADLTTTILANARLDLAHLVSAKLINADLSGARLGGADLRGADLTGAILNGTILTNAKLEGVIGLERARDIDQAIWATGRCSEVAG